MKNRMLFLLMTVLVVTALAIPLAVPVIGARGNAPASPSPLAAEMNQHLEQATAHIDQVDQAATGEQGVNVELLQSALVEFTLAQRVIHGAPPAAREELGYRFSQVALDEMHRLNQLALRSEGEDALSLKAFVQAIAYIVQEVWQEVYLSS